MSKVERAVAELRTRGEISTTAELVVFVVERRAALLMPWTPMQKLFSMK
jgi:hypothetical protein